jgi:glycosyltransferase involved in cell wall biosynthesis
MDKLTVGLFNDSFPPTIDGVANVVINYAKSIHNKLGYVVVATPHYPDVVDHYPFEVIRYPSANVSKRIGYRAGYPFSSKIVEMLMIKNIDIIHTHSPFSSAILARVVRHYTGAPIVITYHTKFDIDINRRIAFNPLRKVSLRFLLSNINACDEVWAVSEGAGENLRKIGYKGDYLIMENGVDYQKGKSSQDDMDRLRMKLALHQTITFLYVGRMMWYKGIKITLDALKIAKDQGRNFKMIFVGDGLDAEAIRNYTKELNLENQCIFTGSIYDRDELKTYYSIADLFLFPSTFDTNGIVIREASACSCPSILIKDSAAAEGIENDYTGILIEENKDSMAIEIIKACDDRKRLKRIGQNANENIYISWDDAVEKAYRRYEFILDNYQKKELKDTDYPIFIREFKLVKKRILKGRRKINDQKVKIMQKWTRF